MLVYNLLLYSYGTVILSALPSLVLLICGSSLSEGPAARESLQRRQMLFGSGPALFLDGAIADYHRLPQHCQAGTSAAATTRRRLHHRRAQRGVEILHQFPRSPIRNMQ